MIFDNTTAEKLYVQYLESQDSLTLSKLHEMSSPLIGAIAHSISPNYCDDLAQEAHIKLHTLLRSGTFDPAQSSMYNYLSFVLKNCMIDYIRKERSHNQLGDNDKFIDENFSMAVECPDYEYISFYAEHRFPSFHSSVSNEMAEYVYFGIIEDANQKSRGTISTMELLYPVTTRQAYVFYQAMTVFTRCHAANGNSMHIDDAIEAAEENEFSLYPEIVLSVGKSIANFVKQVFKGSYVKL